MTLDASVAAGHPDDLHDAIVSRGYKIIQGHVDINVDTREATVTWTISFQQPQSHLRCHARSVGIEIHSVSAHQISLPFTHESISMTWDSAWPAALRDSYAAGELVIALPQPCPNVLEITIHYLILPSVHWRCMEGSESFEQVLYATGHHAAFWLPCWDSFHDKCPMDILYRLTDDGSHKCPRMVLSTGQRSVIRAPSGAQNQLCFLYRHTTPLSVKQLGFAVGRFLLHPIVTIPPSSSSSGEPPGGTSHAFQAMCLSAHCIVSHTRLQKVRVTVNCIPRFIDTIVRALDLMQWPWPSLSLVFVEGLAESFLSCAGLILVNVHLLYDASVVEPVQSTRFHLAEALSCQLFGQWLLPASSRDMWLIQACAIYLADLCFRRLHGTNTYRYRFQETMEHVARLDSEPHGIVIWRQQESNATSVASTALVQSIQRESYLFPSGPLASSVKGSLLLYMISRRIGKNNVSKTLSRWLTNQRSLSTLQFLKWIRKSSTKHPLRDLIEPFLTMPGLPSVSFAYGFQRKRSSVELTVNQQGTCPHQHPSFQGNLTIRVHESDGTYDHVIALEGTGNVQKCDLTYHTKYKKVRRAAGVTAVAAVVEESNTTSGAPLELLPLTTSEQLGGQSSPIAWVRIDPDQEWIGLFQLRQPEFMWQEQALRDKNVLAQRMALRALQQITPSYDTLDVCLKILRDETCFIQVRCEAVSTLAMCAVPSLKWRGLEVLLEYYTSRYCIEKRDVQGHIIQLPKPHSWSVAHGLNDYFIQKTILASLALIRDKSSGPFAVCPERVKRFLLNQLKWQSTFQESAMKEDYFVANLITAVSECILPLADQDESSGMSETLHDPIHEILDQEMIQCIFHYLDHDRLFPSYRNIISIHCLEALKRLYLCGRVSLKLDFFVRRCLQRSSFIQVRLVCLDAWLVFAASDWQHFKMILEEILVHERHPVLMKYLCQALYRLSFQSPCISLLKQQQQLTDTTLLSLLTPLVQWLYQQEEWILARYVHYFLETWMRTGASQGRMVKLKVMRMEDQSSSDDETGSAMMAVSGGATAKKRKVDSNANANANTNANLNANTSINTSASASVNTNANANNIVSAVDVQPSDNTNNETKIESNVTTTTNLSSNIKDWIKLLDKIQHFPESLPFRYAVDVQLLPHYYLMISCPMDLETLCKRVLSDPETTSETILLCLALILKNCEWFNAPQSAIFIQGQHLKRFIEKHLKKSTWQATWPSEEALHEFMTGMTLTALEKRKCSLWLKQIHQHPNHTRLLNRLGKARLDLWQWRIQVCHFDIIRHCLCLKANFIEAVNHSPELKETPFLSWMEEEWQRIMSLTELDENVSLMPVMKKPTRGVYFTLYEMIEELMQLTCCHYFIEPVDPVLFVLPTYFLLIAQPMDLRTILYKLEYGTYGVVHDKDDIEDNAIMDNLVDNDFILTLVAHDLWQIMENARLFNMESSPVWQSAEEMEKQIEKLWMHKGFKTDIWTQGKLEFTTFTNSINATSSSTTAAATTQIVESIPIKEEVKVKLETNPSFDSNLIKQEKKPVSIKNIKLKKKLTTTLIQSNDSKPKNDNIVDSSSVSVNTSNAHSSNWSNKFRPWCQPFHKEDWLPLHEELCQLEQAAPFLFPVDYVALNLPTYPLVIKEPRDLGTIKENVLNERYVSIQDYWRDVELVFTNCLCFNAMDAAVYQQALYLMKWFEQRTKQWIDANQIDDNSLSSLPKPITEMARQLIKKLLKMEGARVFSAPVNVKRLHLHKYRDMIRHPMDLGTILKKLSLQKYARLIQVEEDVALVFRNCKTFNLPGSVIVALAERMEKEAEEMWRQVWEKVDQGTWREVPVSEENVVLQDGENE